MSSKQLQAALGYPKFPAGRAPRVLFMQADYYLYDDALAAAGQLGWGTQALATQKAGKGDSSFLSNLLTQLVTFRPDFVLTLNHLGFDERGVLAGILEEFDVPLASWFVDHPIPILGGAEANARSNCQVFSFERTSLAWLDQIGFDEPHYLPTASHATHHHPQRIDASRAATLGRPLALVAGSWHHKARHAFPAATRRRAAELGRRETIDQRWLIDERLRQRLAGRKPDFDALQVGLAEASMQKRREFVRALAPLNPTVFGDAAWRDLVPGVQLEPSVDPTRDLPAVFAGSDVNLNVTAEQMPTAVNQRVWDVPGAGGFLLTDAQEDVFEHFREGVDVVTYASFDEARDKAEYYLAHPEERASIAARAFATVEARHRMPRRLECMESVLRARFG